MQRVTAAFKKRHKPKCLLTPETLDLNWVHLVTPLGVTNSFHFQSHRGQLIHYGTSNVTKDSLWKLQEVFDEEVIRVEFCHILCSQSANFNVQWNFEQQLTERTDTPVALHTQNTVRNHRRRNATYVTEYITLVWNVYHNWTIMLPTAAVWGK